MPRELRDVEVEFVSYVDSAANKRTFLLTKSENSNPTWNKEVKLLTKAEDGEKMLVYGVVYEPSTDEELRLDSHNDYMTAEEIERAAHRFMLKAQKIDTQHDFEAGAGKVVESYIAPTDFEIGGQQVVKGSWILVTKATPEIWESIKKGEYTGYSLAGTATAIEKGGEKVEKEQLQNEEEQPLAKSDDEVRGFFHAIKQYFTGKEPVQKGEVADKFNAYTKDNSLWVAWDAFTSTVRTYDWMNDRYMYETDQQKITEALTDLVTIMQGILASDNIMKSIGQPPEEVQKAGKSISAANMKNIQSAYDALGALIEANTKEEEEVTKEQADQITKSIADLTDLVKAQGEKLAELEKGTEQAAEGVEKAEEKATEVEKAQEEATTAISKQLDELTSLVKGMGERLETVEKARGIQKAADADEQPEETVQKSVFGSLFGQK
jgi:methyl-accepting chemotaxis protein